MSPGDVVETFGHILGVNKTVKFSCVAHRLLFFLFIVFPLCFKSVLLVEELLRQQLVLERNHHPYYRVLAFVDKNAYNEWRLEEKNKIQALIRRFWLNPLPSMPELPLHISDKHSEYKELMQRLIMLESKSKITHPVHGGVALTAPLSSKSLRLLKEFRLRYGVGEVFCKLSYLTYLVEHFENALWYIEHVMTTLQDLMDLILSFSSPEIYVEKEFFKMVSVLSLLLKHTKYSLTRIRRLFPENSPDGGVVALVALFEATLEALRLLQIEFPVGFSKLDSTHEFLGHPEKGTLSDLLPSYLRTEMEHRYERVKVIAADELKEHFLSSTLSPQVLLNLIMHIQDEVTYYNNYYNQAFSQYFDVMELAAVSFYSLLMEDIRQLCENAPGSLRRRDEVELCMLNLAFRLSKLDQDWAKLIPVRIQTWREPFKEFALEWLDAIGRNFQKLIPLTTGADLWQAVEVNCTAEPLAGIASKSRRIPQAPQGAAGGPRLSLTPSSNSAFSLVNPPSDPVAKQRSLKRRQANLLYDSSSEEEPTVSMPTTVVNIHTSKLFTAGRTQGNLLANSLQQVNVEVHVPRDRKIDSNKAKIRERQCAGKHAIYSEEKMTSGSDRAKDNSGALEGKDRSDETGSCDLLTVRKVCSEARPSYKNLEPVRSGTPTKHTKIGEQTSNTEDASLNQQCTKDAVLVQHGTKEGIGLDSTEGITAGSQNNKHSTSLGEPDNHRIMTLRQQEDSDSNVFCGPGSNREVALERPTTNEVNVVDEPADSSDATSGLQCYEGTITCEPGNTTQSHSCSNIKDSLVEQKNNNTNEPVILGQSADNEDTVVSTSNILGQQYVSKERDLITGTQSGLMCGLSPVLIQSSNVLEHESEESTNKLGRNVIVNHSVERDTVLDNRGVSIVSQQDTLSLSDGIKEIKNCDGNKHGAVQPTPEGGLMDHSGGMSVTRNTLISASSAKFDLDVDLVKGTSMRECAEPSSKSSGSSVASTPPSRNLGTPFENDKCSDTDTSCNSSDSFDFIEDKWNRERMLDTTAAAISVPRNTCLGPENGFDKDLLESVREEAPPFSTSSQGDFPNMAVDIHNVTGPIEDIIGKSVCEKCLSRQSYAKGKFQCVTEHEKKNELVGISQEVRNEIGVSHARKTASVTIPLPRTIERKVNRSFEHVLGGDSSSCGTRTTEYDSFVSAFASPKSDSSVRFEPSTGVLKEASSQGSIGSFHSTESQVIEPSSQQAGNQEETGDRLQRRQHVRENSKVLPISSSFVDVICAVHRLTAFACHLCKILCLDETCASKTLIEAESVTSVKDESRNQSLAIKQVLGNKLIQVLCSFVQLYSDNVIGLDTCGVEDDILVRVVGERVFRHVRSQREEGLLRGCRFNSSARQHCNTRERTGAFIPPCDKITATETIPGGCEPLTEEMGIRLSNVSILRKILPWLLHYVASCVSGPDSLAPGYGDSERSATYCHNGPSLDGVPSNNIEPETSGACDPAMLHLCRLETAQVKLVTYRINEVFKRILHTLLELRLTGFDLTRRLLPGAGFLSRVLQRFHKVLSQECFNQLLIDTWNSVAQDFSEEGHFLVMKKSLASQHSRLLLQAVAYMMDFFRRGRDGLTPGILAANVEPTLKLFGLYTSSTDRLIAMYQTLSKHVLFMQQQYRGADEFSSSASTHSYQSRVNAPTDIVIKSLYSDLHATCKCFTGTDFVEWVKGYVKENGYDNLGICIGNTATETGLELGQYLLNNGFLVCVATPPTLNQQTSRERREQQEEEDDEEEEQGRYSASERGRVFVNGSLPPDMKINDIVITNRCSIDSSADSGSRSVTRTTEASSNGFDSHDDADDEGDDGDAFQDSIDEILRRCGSCQSERATFYNNPKAFYKFICEEDSERSHLRFREGISDRLNISVKLEQLLCVLYSRKDTDKEARNFLKKVPNQVLAEVVRREKEAAEAYLSPSAGRFRCPFWACHVS